MHKGFVKHLPTDRPFTQLEAMYSLSVDASNQKAISISSYAVLWKWSRTKVRNFLKEIRVEIVHDSPLSEVQNQKGQIRGQIEDRSSTDKRQIRFIIDAALYGLEDRSSTDRVQIENRYEDTTIYPINPNPNPNPIDINITKNFSDGNNCKKNTKKVKKPEDVTDQTWEDWKTHRKSKKAPISQTVIKTFTKEAEKAGMSLEEAIIKAINKGWRGFEADWLKKKNNTKEYLDSLLNNENQNDVILTQDDYGQVED